MDSPVIQVRLKGRVLQTLPFQADVLRIGRMKENDIVIDNVSVSRFHAVLKREKGQVILEDAGSQNGCYVNGTRIASSILLHPDDEVLIGKHQLVLSEEGAQDASSPETAARGKSDAWDASSTYFAGAEVQAKMLEGSGSPPPPEAASVDPQEDPPLPVEPEVAEVEAPPQEVEEMADDIAVGSAEASVEAAEPGTEVEVGSGDDDAVPTDEKPEEGLVELVEPPEPVTAAIQPPEEPSWHAGLIIQRGGKLDRIIRWDQDQLTVGRSGECEVTLDQAEISRRHAMFVREAGKYEVRDLESINGVLVNGEKTKGRRLQVGDTVKIGDFELVFLLDRRRIDDEIETDDLATSVAAGADVGRDVTMVSEDPPIGSDITKPKVVEQPPARVEAAEQMPEDELSGLDDAGEKEIVEVEAVSQPLETEDTAVPVVTDAVFTLELKVRVEDLPEPLRAALADVDASDLKLPAEIVLKTDA
jgi:pSer/pThr/pTyr-binding forkhead associated (FHA) protein